MAAPAEPAPAAGRAAWWAPPGFLPMEPVRVAAWRPRPGWVAEAKWDGVRLLAWCERGGCAFRSRRLRPLPGDWPELVGLGRLAGEGGLLLDGELVALRNGRPSFPAVLARATGRGGTGRAAGELVYALFDLLFAGGRDLRRLAWEERRRELEHRLGGRLPAPRPGAELRLAGLGWERGLQALLTPVHADAAALWRAVEEAGWEGMVLKRRDAPYRAGKAPGAWEKVKRRLAREAVIGGYRSEGGELRALLLGAYDEEGRLRFLGSVGSGIDRRLSARLLPWLEERRREAPPFADAPAGPGLRWVEPELVVLVTFAEWTPGLRLRAPVLAGFSTRPPSACRLA